MEELLNKIICWLYGHDVPNVECGENICRRCGKRV
jgi:hypothetical protein